MDLSGTRTTLRFPGKRTTAEKITPADLIVEKFAEGTCLIMGEAALADADFLIQMQSNLLLPQPDNAATEIDRSISASVKALYRRTNSGFQPIYRETSATVRALTFPLMVGWTSNRSPKLNVGFSRTAIRRNEPTSSDSGTELGNILIGTLKLPLDVVTQDRQEALFAKIDRFLAREGWVNMADRKVINLPFIRLPRNQPVSPKMQALLLKVMADPRQTLVTDAARAVPEPDQASPDYFAALAAAAFARLSVLQQSTGDRDRNGKLYGLSLLIWELPAAALAPYRQEREAVARDRVMRVQMSYALVRLSDFGPDAAETLFWLVDDAANAGKPGKDERENPYTAGLKGLCHLGPQAVATRDRLVDLVRRGEIRLGDSYHAKLAAQTFLRMGMTRENLAALASDTGASFSAFTLDRAASAVKYDRGCH